MFKDNALIIKIKSLYGNRLKEEDYDQLLKMKSIQELFLYLKSHNRYKELLKDVSGDNLHRKDLEILFRKSNFEIMLKLRNFLKMKEDKFYNIFIYSSEKDLILDKIHDIKNQINIKEIIILPNDYQKYTKINIDDLLNSKNLEELNKSIENSLYKQILNPYKSIENSNINFYLFENLFENKYYEIVFEIINKYFKKKEKDELNNLFNSIIELDNIIKIYRLKKFYNYDNDFIRASLIDLPQNSSRKVLEVLNLNNPDQIYKDLKNSKYQYYLDDNDNIYIEYFEDYIKYYDARKNLYFSNKASKVFVSYLLLNELEMKNIFHLIEGIRYNLSEKEIRKLLVY